MLYYFIVSKDEENTPEAKQVLPALLLDSFLFLSVALLLVPFRVLWLQPQVPESASTPKILKMNTVKQHAYQQTDAN